MGGQNHKPREISSFDYMVMMNDFIDNVMPNLKPSEIKMALVIARKTLGWGKRSGSIGKTQLCELANVNPDTYKDIMKGGFCEKTGIKMEQGQERGVLRRRVFTWPMSEEASANLEKATRALKGGKFPPRQKGPNTPNFRGQNPPTQYSNNTSEPLQAALACAVKKLRESRASRGYAPLGHLDFYYDEG